MRDPEYLRGQKIARSPGNKPEASGATGRAYRHEAAFKWGLNPVPTWATGIMNDCKFVKFCVVPRLLILLYVCVNFMYMLCITRT